MIDVILLGLLVALPIHIFARLVRTKYARSEAIRIITSQQCPTVKHINKTITLLLASKTWFQSITEQDRHLVWQLRDMRNEMVTPRP